MKIVPSISVICGVGFLLFLGHLLVPVFAEWSGQAEIDLKAKLDAESCPGTEYQIINNLTYCEYKGQLVKPKDYERLIK